MNIEKFVKKVTKKLDAEGLCYEVTGDKHSFAISPTCTIYSNQCTIEIHKNSITVNDQSVIDIEEMMEAVMELECGVNIG